MQKYENIILARLLIAEKQFAEALTLLEQVLPDAIQAERLMLIIEVESLQAIALHALGKKSEAIEVLTEALRLAEPEGFVRLFVDQGHAVEELLEKTRMGEKDKTTIAYIDRLLEAYTHKTGEVEPSPSRKMMEIIEPLSDREKEVLRLLPTGLSSTEMAEELTISVNTLRTHLKNIYTKLGVHSRYEAIESKRDRIVINLGNEDYLEPTYQVGDFCLITNLCDDSSPKIKSPSLILMIAFMAGS